MLAWTAISAIENEGEREFMEMLYTANYGAMYQKALSYLHNHHEAEDVVEAVMLKLIDRADLLRGCKRASLRSYLLACVRNAAINRLRRAKKRYSFADVEDKLNALPDEGAVDACLLREAQVQAMICALEQLPDREREMLQMKYYDGLSDAEIARILAIGPNSVRTLIDRARKRVRKILTEVEQ